MIDRYGGEVIERSDREEMQRRKVGSKLTKVGSYYYIQQEQQQVVIGSDSSSSKKK